MTHSGSRPLAGGSAAGVREEHRMASPASSLADDLASHVLASARVHGCHRNCHHGASSEAFRGVRGGAGWHWLRAASWPASAAHTTRPSRTPWPEAAGLVRWLPGGAAQPTRPAHTPRALLHLDLSGSITSFGSFIFLPSGHRESCIVSGPQSLRVRHLQASSLAPRAPSLITDQMLRFNVSAWPHAQAHEPHAQAPTTRSPITRT